jgi:GT2 family glycosyltransferase
MNNSGLKISILIVTHNSFPDIKHTLDSISKHILNFNYEVIVIDNASTESDIQDYLKKQFELDKIELVSLQKNVGFGRANNIAFNLASSDNILILNPDISFDDCSERNILRIIEFVESKSSIGAASPRLLKPNGSLDLNYRLNIEPFQLILNRFKKILTGPNKVDKLQDIELKVKALAGAFIIIKARNYKLINGFDERYFMYSEDLDFSLKIQSYGLELFVLTDLFFKHNVGSSSRKKPYRMVYHMYKSIVQFYLKWGVLKFTKDFLLFIIITPFVVIEIMIRLFKKNKNVSD